MSAIFDGRTFLLAPFLRGRDSPNTRIALAYRIPSWVFTCIVQFDMRIFTNPAKPLMMLALLLSAGSTALVSAQSTDTKKPDNTANNKGDQKPGAVTADQQKSNATDRDLTARIRRSIMANKSLSAYAHNIKIVSQNAIVTLKGPVRSDDEVRTIMASAVEIAGADNVVNQLIVQPSSKQ
jgi:hyperosmotically inducible protein